MKNEQTIKNKNLITLAERRFLKRDNFCINNLNTNNNLISNIDTNIDNKRNINYNNRQYKLNNEKSFLYIFIIIYLLFPICI